MNDAILRQIERLGLATGQFLVVGSGILSALGIRQSNDCDIIVSAQHFDMLAAQGGRLGCHQDGTRALYIGDIEVMDDWFGEDITSLMPRAVEIDRVRYLSLDEVMSYKRKLGRSKDIADIELIKAYKMEHPDATT